MWREEDRRGAHSHAQERLHGIAIEDQDLPFPVAGPDENLTRAGEEQSQPGLLATGGRELECQQVLSGVIGAAVQDPAG